MLKRSVALSLLLFPSLGFAAGYADVPRDAWYAPALASLQAKGALDASQKNFRPGSPATRAEFLKLTLAVSGTAPQQPPLLQSFDDSAPDDWHYTTIEEAARQSWVRGDGNCYGEHPCRARPDDRISRAEAAVLITRIFVLEKTDAAPPFIDTIPDSWYSYGVQASADRCILAGDPATGSVRPNDPVNRAEMAIMLDRVSKNQFYGKECGKMTPK